MTDWIAYILLALALLGDGLLLALLLRRPKQQDNTDALVRALTEVMEGETDVLADQLRTMQGELTRTTVSSVRYLSSQTT